MLKRIRPIGNSAGVIFTKEDLSLYGLKIGDIIDLSEIFKSSKGEGDKK